METAPQDLVRKQFLLNKRHLKKLAEINKAQNYSESEIVRRALEAYDPALEKEFERLIDMAAKSVSEAIELTDKAIAKTVSTVELLEKSEKTFSEKVNGRN